MYSQSIENLISELETLRSELKNANYMKEYWRTKWDDGYTANIERELTKVIKQRDTALAMCDTQKKNSDMWFERVLELQSALKFQFALSIGLLHAYTDEKIPETIKEISLNLIDDMPENVSVYEMLERSASLIGKGV